MARGGKREGAGRKPGARNKRPAGIPKLRLRRPEQEPPAAPTPPASSAKRAVAVLSVIEGGNGAITEPDWSLYFSDELDLAIARVQWGILIKELRETEKLSAANAHQVKRTVIAQVLFEVATRHVAEEGAVFPRKGKKQPAYNPWFTVWKDTNAIATSGEAELTITPRKRNNGGKVAKKKPSQIGGGYLRPISK